MAKPSKPTAWRKRALGSKFETWRVGRSAQVCTQPDLAEIKDSLRRIDRALCSGGSVLTTKTAS